MIYGLHEGMIHSLYDGEMLPDRRACLGYVGLESTDGWSGTIGKDTCTNTTIIRTEMACQPDGVRSPRN